MMNSMEPKKVALIRIGQILKKYSDCDHPLTQEKIQYYLEREYGITIERKAVSRNISLLKELGADIESGKKGSYLASRIFDDAELRLLIDSVLSSQHITVNHSISIIDKLCSMSNTYFSSHNRQIYSINEWNKSENEDLFYNIEIVGEAIVNKKQIHYDYNKFDIRGKLRKTSEQTVSPYQMFLHNQRYYLMAYSSYWGNMSFHRLDHMTNMKILDEPAYPLKKVPGYQNGINYKRISTAMPYMYADPPQTVEFIADACIVDQIVDWFGKNARIRNIGEDGEKVRVTMRVSLRAMELWAMQYLKHVEITSPAALRDQIRENLKEAAEKYGADVQNSTGSDK